MKSIPLIFKLSLISFFNAFCFFLWAQTVSDVMIISSLLFAVVLLIISIAIYRISKNEEINGQECKNKIKDKTFISLLTLFLTFSIWYIIFRTIVSTWVFYPVFNLILIFLLALPFVFYLLGKFTRRRQIPHKEPPINKVPILTKPYKKLVIAIIAIVGIVYFIFLPAESNSNLKSIPGISNYTISKDGVLFEVDKIKKERFRDEYTFQVRAKNIELLNKDRIIIVKSSRHLNNLVRELEYFLNKHEWYGTIAGTVWETIKGTFSGIFNIVIHPFNTVSAISKLPRVVYEKVDGFIDDPDIEKILIEGYKNELIKKANEYRLEYDYINLPETIKLLKSELNTELATKSATAIFEILIPAGVGLKVIKGTKYGIKATEKMNKINKKGHSNGKKGNNSNSSNIVENKETFYKKADEALTSAGYKNIDEKDI